MKSGRPTFKARAHAVIALAFAIGASKVLWMATVAYAGSLSSASIQLSDPRPAQSGTTYAINFTVGSATLLKSFRAQMCTTQTGSCTTPAGFSAASATLTSQPTGYGDASGWSSDPVSGSLQMMKAGNTAAPSGSQQISFSGVTNPANEAPYFLRLATFSDANYTDSVDSAVVSLVIVPGITVSATVDPTLNFAVTGLPASTIYKGTLSTADRCLNSASAITFGSPLQPLSPDTDYDCGQSLTTSTNGIGGYQVTVHTVDPGNTMKNGPSSIPDWTGTNASPAATPGGSTALFAYTTNDPSLSGSANRFSGSDNLFAGLSNTPAEVAYNTSTIANDTVNVAYRLRFTFLSAAGTYTGKVVYTCTATF